MGRRANLRPRLALASMMCAFACVCAYAVAACSFTLDDVAANADGSPDALVGGDGGPITSADGGRCVPTGPEICSDGVDNDCNGLTDCQDPACATAACQLPRGWTYAFLDLDSTGKCPSQYPSSSLIRPDIINETQARQCLCTCGVPCGPLTMTSGVLGSPTCASNAITIPTSTSCTPFTFAQASYKFSAPTAACSPGSTRPTPQGRNGGGNSQSNVVCRGTGFAGTCQGGSCLESGGQNPACVQAPGDVPCVSGYPFRYLASLGSNDTNDTRVCPQTCGCGQAPGATCAGTVRLYYDSLCVGSAGTFTLNSAACASTTSDAGPIAYRLAGQNNGCVPNDDGGVPVVSGSVSFKPGPNAEIMTICCTR